MMAGIDAEVWMAAGYAALLALIAAGLEAAARQSHLRSLQYRTAGFTYHRELDAWKCPTGQELRRTETDHARRLARYRAHAHVCNACRVKPQCTDSDQGREIEHPLEGWLAAEEGRFHRGISLLLLLLASLILMAELFCYRRPHDLILLSALLAPVSVTGLRMFTAFLGR